MPDKSDLTKEPNTRDLTNDEDFIAANRLGKTRCFEMELWRRAFARVEEHADDAHGA